MSPEALLVVAAVLGFYMAFNIGGNDVANAMGTSVGSGALTMRQAILVAAVFEFAGAVLVGGNVTRTVGSGLLHLEQFAGAEQHYMLGMLAALLAAALWLNLATYLGMPVSTTHSIVGAVWGFGLVFSGLQAIVWGKLGQVVASWLISPLAGFALSFLLFRFIDRAIIDAPAPMAKLRRVAPVFVFTVCGVLALSMIYKGLQNLRLDMPLGRAAMIAAVIGFVGATVGSVLIRRVARNAYASRREEYQAVEGVFRYLQIMTACYVAFAHGANDVANAVGPLSSVAAILSTGAIPDVVEVPLWVLGLGGTGIVIGLAIIGPRVIATIGSRITEMTPTRGFAAEFGAASTVLVCSKLGMPISTTHTLVGCVIGIGMARGFAALDLRVVRSIVASWFITLPVTAILTMVIYHLLAKWLA